MKTRLIVCGALLGTLIGQRPLASQPPAPDAQNPSTAKSEHTGMVTVPPPKIRSTQRKPSNDDDDAKLCNWMAAALAGRAQVPTGTGEVSMTDPGNWGADGVPLKVPETRDELRAMLKSTRVRNRVKAELLGISGIELHYALKRPGGVEAIVARIFPNFDLYELSGRPLVPPDRAAGDLQPWDLFGVNDAVSSAPPPPSRPGDGIPVPAGPEISPTVLYSHEFWYFVNYEMAPAAGVLSRNWSPVFLPGDTDVEPAPQGGQDRNIHRGTSDVPSSLDEVVSLYDLLALLPSVSPPPLTLDDPLPPDDDEPDELGEAEAILGPASVESMRRSPPSAVFNPDARESRESERTTPNVEPLGHNPRDKEFIDLLFNLFGVERNMAETRIPITHPLYAPEIDERSEDYLERVGPDDASFEPLVEPETATDANSLQNEQTHLEKIDEDVSQTTGKRVVPTEDDHQRSVKGQAEPFARADATTETGARQWALARIGLSPEEHPRVLDECAPPGDGPRAKSEAVRFHLHRLLEQPAATFDGEQFRADLAAETAISAGEMAVLAGRARDARHGLRRPSRMTDASSVSRDRRSSGPVVAVIDSGVDLAHPELWGQLWRNPGEIPANGIDDERNGFVDDVFGYNFVGESTDVSDDCGHGTHVAGIIAARHDGRGIAGVCPHSRLMILKAGDAHGQMTPIALVRAIHYAVKNGAQIIHMSLGVSPPGELEAAVIEWARRRGVLLVAAAGSDGNNTAEMAPASLPGVLTVGATTRRDVRAPLSAWGNQLDLVAPGVDILSLRAASTDFLNALADRSPHAPRGERHAELCDYAATAFAGAVVNDRWYRAGGTSFSAPFVTGVAALIFSRDGTLSSEQVKRMILMTCDDIDRPGWDNETGAGLLNARRALAADPDHSLDARITHVALGRHAGEPVLEVHGSAEGTHLKGLVLEVADRGDSERGQWRLVSESTTDEAISDGLLGRIPGRLFDRHGTWNIRCVVQDTRGAVRQAAVSVALD